MSVEYRVEAMEFIYDGMAHATELLEEHLNRRANEGWRTVHIFRVAFGDQKFPGDAVRYEIVWERKVSAERPWTDRIGRVGLGEGAPKWERGPSGIQECEVPDPPGT